MWERVLALAARMVDRRKGRRRQAALRVTTVANTDWDGSAQELLQYQAVQMTATPNGTIVLAASNIDTKPNAGEIAISSAGGQPLFVELPALTNQPVLVANNYGGNNLKVTNTATAAVRVEIFAPGFGSSGALPDTGDKLPLPSRASRTTISATSFQQLILSNASGQTTFLFYAGATAALYTVNTSSAPNVPNIENHSVLGNEAKITENWAGQTLYVANVSSLTDAATVVLLTF